MCSVSSPTDAIPSFDDDSDDGLEEEEEEDRHLAKGTLVHGTQTGVKINESIRLGRARAGREGSTGTDAAAAAAVSVKGEDVDVGDDEEEEEEEEDDDRFESSFSEERV